MTNYVCMYADQLPLRVAAMTLINPKYFLAVKSYFRFVNLPAGKIKTDRYLSQIKWVCFRLEVFQTVLYIIQGDCENNNRHFTGLSRLKEQNTVTFYLMKSTNQQNTSWSVGGINASQKDANNSQRALSTDIEQRSAVL